MPQQPLSIVSIEDTSPDNALSIVGMEDVSSAAPRRQTSPSLELARNVTGPLGAALAAALLPDWARETADVVAAPAMRVIPAVGGAVIGGALGGPLGAAIGGGAGAGFGETGAEALEVQTGQRESFNPKQVATQAVLGAIPVVGKARGVLPTVASRAAQGGALGGVGAASTSMAEGETPALGDIATATSVGALLGGVGGAAEARLNRPAVAPAPRPEVDAPPMVPRAEPMSVRPQPLPDIVEIIDIPPVTPEQKIPKPKPPMSRRAEREQMFAEFGAREADEATDIQTPHAVDQSAAHSGKGVFRREPVVGSAPGGKTGAKLADLQQKGPRSGWRNERGEVNPELLAGAAGALAGGGAGAATGDDAESRLQNAILGAAAGTAAGVGGARFANRGAQVADDLTPLAALDPAAAERLGPGTFAGPERRVVPRTAGPQKSQADIDYERVRERQARGDLRPTEMGRELLEQRTALDRSREAAAQARGEVPLPRHGARVPPGEPIPAQQPLTEARKQNDEVFVSKQPEPFREGLRTIIDENNHFEAQRRGVQPVERTNALARYVQTERMKLLPKGTALNAEELKAYSDNLATVTDRIDELSQRIIKGEGSAADVAALEKARIEQHVLLTNAMGARAETGRALNIHKQFAQIFESKDAKALEEAMKIPGVNMEEVATRLASLKTDAEKLDYLRSLQKHSPLDMGRSYYYANILSGLRTHIRNIFGNAVNGAFNVSAGVAATGYDLARSTATGKPRTMYFGELKPRAVGAVMGVKQGIDDALFTITHGYTPKALGTFDVPRPELPGGGKNPFNLVGRVLEAEDQLFYGINYNMELYGRLYARARGKGLTGDALADQVAQWKLSPPRDVAEAAEKAAMRAVFKEDPGKWTAAIMGLKKEIPFLNFVMPFVKTPANILRQGIEATPAAFLTKQTREAFARGGREQAEVMGRVMAGTTALAALAYWASQGKISGTGPTDPEKRAALMESGWRPNSIKLPEAATKALGLDGDTWVSFDQIQPLAQPLYAVANAWEKYREDGKVDSTSVLGAMGKAIVDQSFFSGVSDLNNALSDPDRYAEQFKQRVAQGFVPFSGMSRNIAQAMDTTVRQPKGVAESVKSIIPGVSKSVEPKIDRLGQDIQRSGGSLVQLTPFNVGRPSKDPVVQELTRLKVDSLGVPPKSIPATKTSPKIELTVDERKRMGQAVRQDLERLFKHSGWQRLNEDRARDRIQDAARRARSRIIAQIRRERRSEQ